MRATEIVKLVISLTADILESGVFNYIFYRASFGFVK